MDADQQTPTLAVLASMAGLADDMNEAVTRLVIQAKREGAVWQDIGTALNITRQGAFARYARLVAEAEGRDAQAR